MRTLKDDRGFASALGAFIVLPCLFAWEWRRAEHLRLRSAMRAWLAGVFLLFTTPSAGYALTTWGAIQGHAPPAAEPRSAVSPDGRFEVRVDGEPASQRLLLTQVSTGDAVVIHYTPGITYLDVSFSADGHYIRFTEARANQPAVRYEIPMLGGAARRIADQTLVVAPAAASVAAPAPGRDLGVLTILGTLLIAFVLAYRAVRQRQARERTPPVAGPGTSVSATRESAPDQTESKTPEAKPAAPSSSTEFTLWVRDPNPGKPYLLALLIKVCREHRQDIPDEFTAYADGERSRQLSYRTSPNRSKGGTDVTWVLTGSHSAHGGGAAGSKEGG